MVGTTVSQLELIVPIVVSMLTTKYLGKLSTLSSNVPTVTNLPPLINMIILLNQWRVKSQLALSHQRSIMATLLPIAIYDQPTTISLHIHHSTNFYYGMHVA